MLCKLQNVKKLCLRIAFLSILVFNVTAIVWAPLARAQASSSEHTDGIISGTVLLKESHRPASQVAVKLKSHAAGIFRSVLTDLEGHFEVRSLPRSTYEIVVEEPGYEPRKRVRSSMALPRSSCFTSIRPAQRKAGGTSTRYRRGS